MESLRPDMFQNIEIIIVQQGLYKYRYEDIKGELNPFAICIVPPGIRYNFNVEGEGTITFFSLEPKYITKHLLDLSNQELVNFFTNTIPSSFLIYNNSTIQDKIKPSINQLITLCNDNPDCIVSHLFKILNILNNLYEIKNEYMIVFNSIAYLLGGIYASINNDVDITLNEAAEKLNYSREHVSRAIHKYTGKTFTDLQAEVRLKKAMDLLKNTDMDIEEVAILSGFTSKQYINRMFTRYTGVTPLQYRRLKKPKKSMIISSN